MRIGMMADMYKPHISGVTSYISLNKRYLESLGHEVFVFTFGDEEYQDDEQNVVRSTGIPVSDTGFYLSFRYGSRARQLVKTMDVVHVHHPFLSGSLALRYCRPRGIPIVFTNHTRYDLYAQAYLPGMPEVVSITALQAFLPSFCRAVDLVVSPSPGMRDVLVHLGVDAPIEVVPNGVDLARFKQPSEPIDRSQFGFFPQDVILIYTGRLGPEKNLPFLLRSFAGTVRAYESVRLLVVGDGPEKSNMQEQVKDMAIEKHVHFTGMVEYDRMAGLLATADAFVTASVTEVHPYTVIEAMAMGLPVLGIKSPGVGDTIEDTETGLLVDGEDLASFTAKMVRLIVEPYRRKMMGEKARKESQRYSIENTSQMMLDCYQKVIARASGRKRGLRARWTRLWDWLAR
jgi:glycosyltransferase involved in cell wall biosynthesis